MPLYRQAEVVTLATQVYAVLSSANLTYFREIDGRRDVVGRKGSE